MAKTGRHGKRRRPGGPSRPSAPGRVTPPSTPGGAGSSLTIKNPSIDGLVSSILSMVRQAAPPGARGRALGIELWADHMAVSLYDPDAMPRAYYEELAAGLAASTDPDAPAVLAALATALVHDDARPLRAGQAAAVATRPEAEAEAEEGALSSGGDDLGIGRAGPTRARVIGHVLGDGVTIVVDFDQPGAAHSLTAFVDHNLLGLATDLSVGPPWEAQEEALEVEAEPGVTVTEIPLAEARARIEHAMDLTDHSPGAPVADSYVSLARLAGRRVALLPRGGRVPERPTISEEEVQALVAAFLGAPEAEAIPAEHRDHTGWVVELWLDHAVNETVGGPLRVSAAMVEQFCVEWYPRTATTDAETTAAAPGVLAAWVRYAARVNGLPERWRDETLDQLDRVAVHLADEVEDDSWEGLDLSPGSADPW